MSQSLTSLIQEAQQTILQIRNHPDYKQIALNYSPDLTRLRCNNSIDLLAVGS
ncbi:hypothetical protein ACN23B_30490 (plasmid) [Anabaena sp. FACHB-709]|uniref:Uncharacterized protein n=2 Tax=Nostocaceae TaxID=1162 RepID=A0A1Z4KX06_ANAVA|nr:MULTISPECIES: hypothetical protein [Nostocaceae]BAY73489.1 hypothetical protein NIES23_63410 [Trichormus variabilis NIES-23]MBD2174586.1 hypothetical protein [Anabaena cylindrica FACHB-318]MBD2266363.1 hypothetical protein [Anabaena sp. FACHB-709]MBD2275759.1 hypothetical protein [Nostoc sp. PCC 7120 = FACHB-418]MBD2287171.1 hypothetical protein [Anabaena cylindrica FACHB-170]